MTLAVTCSIAVTLLLVVSIAAISAETHREEPFDVTIVDKGWYMMRVICNGEMERLNPSPKSEHGKDRSFEDVVTERTEKDVFGRSYSTNIKMRAVVLSVAKKSVVLKIPKGHKLELDTVTGKGISHVDVTKSGRIKCTGSTADMTCDYE